MHTELHRELCSGYPVRFLQLGRTPDQHPTFGFHAALGCPALVHRTQHSLWVVTVDITLKRLVSDSSNWTNHSLIASLSAVHSKDHQARCRKRSVPIWRFKEKTLTSRYRRQETHHWPERHLLHACCLPYDPPQESYWWYPAHSLS